MLGYNTHDFFLDAVKILEITKGRCVPVTLEHHTAQILQVQFEKLWEEPFSFKLPAAGWFFNLPMSCTVAGSSVSSFPLFLTEYMSCCWLEKNTLQNRSFERIFVLTLSKYRCMHLQNESYSLHASDIQFSIAVLLSPTPSTISFFIQIWSNKQEGFGIAWSMLCERGDVSVWMLVLNMAWVVLLCDLNLEWGTWAILHGEWLKSKGHQKGCGCLSINFVSFS